MGSFSEAVVIHPLIKWLLAAWLALWVPLHLLAYPASTFLWPCAYGNVLIVIGICCESRLLVSWQAVALLLPQLVYLVDVMRRGPATAYLFDPVTPFAVRSLSLFHFAMPFVLLYAVARLGYDRRALPLQLATSVIALAISLGVGPINVWVWANAREHVLMTMALAPLALHLPAHAALLRLSRYQR
jgi:hypothetical protein